MPTQPDVHTVRFEGPDLEALLEDVRGRFGADVTILEANRIRTGGLGGFFAREAYEVVVELDGPEEAPADADAAPGAPRARSLMDLVDDVDDAFVPAGGHGAPTTDRTDGMASPATVEALLAATADGPVPDEHADHEQVHLDAPVGVAALLARLDEARARGAAPLAPTEASLSTDGEAFASVLDRIARGSGRAVDDRDAGDGPDGDAAFRSYADVARAGRPAPAAPQQPGPQHPVTQAGTHRPGTPSAATDLVVAVGDDHVPDRDDAGCDADLPARTRGLRPQVVGEPTPDAVLDVASLVRLGLPAPVLDGPLRSVDRIGGLLELAERLPRPRRLPSSGDAVIALVGDRAGMERAVAWIQEELGLSPDLLALATRSESRVFPLDRRIASHDDAADRRRAWRRRPLPTLVVIDDPVSMRGTAWTRHVLDALEPTAVWAVVDAQRKPEDVVEWSERIGGVDAIALDGTAETSSPAAVLSTGLPVALVDGEAATPARWAALLDERLQAA